MFAELFRKRTLVIFRFCVGLQVVRKRDIYFFEQVKISNKLDCKLDIRLPTQVSHPDCTLTDSFAYKCKTTLLFKKVGGKVLYYSDFRDEHKYRDFEFEYQTSRISMQRIDIDV